MEKQEKLTQGILLIDKPTGWTSFDVVAKIRRLSGVKKVGHAGTLDPLATGLLIVLVGKTYTKLQDSFVKQDKTYLCTVKLGLSTDSYDIDGQIVAQADWDSYKNISEFEIKQALSNFQGKIIQTVPAFSAVKKNGKKLYDLARKGKIDVKNLPSREVEIKKIELLSFRHDEQKKDLTFDFKINCSSGTYIRSLVHDLGQKLGCGATVMALRRIKIGPYNIAQAQLIDQPLIFHNDVLFHSMI